MRIRLEENKAYDDCEITICCNDRENVEVQQALQALESLEKRLIVNVADVQETILIPPSIILYAECVDNRIYVYTSDNVYRTHRSLSQLETDFNFFRCSKSMVINIKKISQLKSNVGGKIMAQLSNGEKILISRHYASMFRQKIK